MGRAIDITLMIRPGMPVWPGDPNVVLERVSKIEEGANANVSRLALSVHTGTHMDAPIHFIQGGGTIDQIPLEILIGKVQVVELQDLGSGGHITDQVIESCGLQEGIERVIFKTLNTHFWIEKPNQFQTQFIGVTADGAEELVRHKIRLVGIDYLSVAPFKQSRPTHQILLGAGLVVVEGLDLTQVQAGLYQLICLPLKLGGSDGSPVRAVLIEE
jgi:arylformamidase